MTLEPEEMSADERAVQIEEPQRSSSSAARKRTTRANTAANSLQRVATTLGAHLQPDKKLAPPPTLRHGLWAIITSSWLNVLLVFIPISWILNFVKKDDHTLVFIFSFLAIIPLAKLLSFATEEISLRVGQTLAGLMNATLGNAVELIVAALKLKRPQIIALVKCELQVVQSSLVGSILSNILLVLGMCFFAGGTRFSEQGFGLAAAQINSTLLIISVIVVLLPAAFHFTIDNSSTNERTDILSVSHGVAIILLFIYGSYLVFQLFSHKQLYEDGEDSDVAKSTKYAPRKKKHPEVKDLTNVAPSDCTANPQDPESSHGHEKEPEEEETPQLSVWLSVILLATVTVLVAITAEWLVDSIDGLTASGKISKEFVGIILLPIVGNAAEHVTAVSVSVKDKLTLSIGVAVGSSIQIALFVIPFIVTLGWIIGKPLTMLFDPFESVALFLSVITVNYVIQDGKSNWLEGMLLMCLYIILAVSFWFYVPSKSIIDIFPCR
ncbi:hypothetical protein JAAARDRAFT_194344 [Jaapia argillacea MUCL 33604]|uniref:Sodium/calcium exchanger membrane region domain-containing protein n=1 Tax=Jaapia argillacea MUCL 33604 TaxID=933084 RepID=A0A067PQY3_9AGAM|nr:hypothetical protein JAAARDRAFT_194344 [Jaapia argillacea MUCL 33604]